MRVLFLYLLLICSSIGGIYLYAQEKCAADAALNARLQQFGITRDEYAAQFNALIEAREQRIEAGEQDLEEKVYKIPVVFHELRYEEGTRIPKQAGSMDTYPDPYIITEEMVQQQLDTLNKCFKETHGRLSLIPDELQSLRAGNIGIEFYLATKDTLGFPMAEPGIHRVPTRLKYIPASVQLNSPVIPNELLAKIEWDQSKYLNVYLIPAPELGLLSGRATVPLVETFEPKGWTHPRGTSSIIDDFRPAGWSGVVINMSAFGSGISPDGSSFGNLGRTLVHEIGHYLGLYHPFSSGDCVDADYCDDTPTSNASAGRSTCGVEQTTCGSKDMPENYMEYGTCRLLFTPCQRTRMRTAMEYGPLRRGLWQSEDKITTVVAQENDLGIISFSIPNSNVCQGSLQGKLKVGNYGTNAISSLEIDLFLNGTKVSTLTKNNINIASYATKEISFDPISISSGKISLEARVLTVNGGTDPNSDNNAGTYVAHHAATVSNPFFTEDFESANPKWIIPPGNTIAEIVSTADNSGKMLAFSALNSPKETVYTGYTLFSPLLDFSTLPSDEQVVLSFRYNYRGSPEKTLGAFFVGERIECSDDSLRVLDYLGIFDAHTDVFQAIGEKPQYDHQWKTITLPLPEVSSSTQLGIGLINNKSGNLYIDNIEIRKKAISSKDLSVESLTLPTFMCDSYRSVFSLSNYSNETLNFEVIISGEAYSATTNAAFKGNLIPLDKSGIMPIFRDNFFSKTREITPHSPLIGSFVSLFTGDSYTPEDPYLDRLSVVVHIADDSDPKNNSKAGYTHISSFITNMPSSPLSTEAGSNFKWYPATSTQDNSDWAWIQYKENHFLSAPLLNNDQMSEGAYLKLISQPISLADYTDPTLSFYVAYAQRGTVEDRLRLFVFEDCVSVPTEALYDKAGARLATAGNNWRKEIIDLSAYAGKTLLHFMFVATNKGGNDMYLDNIGLHNTAKPTVTAPSDTPLTLPILRPSSISGLTSISATLNVTSDKAGTLYWVLLAGSNTTSPSAAEVVDGTGPAGAAALGNGNAAISANTSLSETISGLNASTAYKVYFCVQEGASNRSNVLEKTFTTKAPTPPRITSSSISGLTSTFATLNVTSNKAGTLYWVLLPGSNTTAPSATEVIYGTGPAGAVSLDSRNEVINANTALSKTIYALTASTDYKVYFLVRDRFSNNSPIVEKTFTTLPVPIITNISISGLTSTFATLNVTSDKAGTLYWLLAVGSSTASLSAATVINNATGNAAISANTERTVLIRDLRAGTAYKVYFCVQEGASNRSNVLEKTFTTKAPTAPGITSSSISGIIDISATLNVTSDKAGTLYWVLLAGSNTTFPSAAEVVNGTGPAGAAALGNGNAAIPANNRSLSETISGLTENTAYKVYFCVQDGASNRSHVLEKTFTANTLTTPGITSSSISGLTSISATLNVTSNKAGTLYWVLLAGSNIRSPSAAEVINDTGPAGVAALASGSATIAANTSLSEGLSGLTPSTAYKVYFCVQEGASNRSHVLEKAFTTNAPPPPRITSSSISGIIDISATLNVTSTEAGALYWVLLAGANTTAPNATEIVNGTGPAGATSLNNGNETINANTPLSETISGLNPSTDYKVYFLVRDHFSNNSPIVEKTFATSTPIPPSITSSGIAGTAPTFATLNVTSTRAGTLYWVLLAGANTTAPSATEVVNGTGPAGVASLNNGNVAIKANTLLSETVSGLTASTDYKVYFLVRDRFSNNSPIVEKTFTTLPAPSISTSSISGITDISATLNVTSAEAGTLYWVLLAGSNTTAPSATEIVNGTGPAGTAPLNNGNELIIGVNTTLSETISGLNPSTDYKVYFLVRDHFSNNSPIVEKTFATSTLILPSITSSGIAGTAPTFATLNVTSTRAGTLYWVLLAGSNTTAPSATEVVNGTGPAGAAPLNNGNEAITANTVLSETISGLNPSTDYKVYFLVRDRFSNSPIVEKAFTTTLIISASSISGITTTSATLNVTGIKAGTLYWVLLAGSNTTAPNATEVVNGTGPAGAATLGNGSAVIAVNTALSETLSGLNPSTDYKVYFCVQASASNRGRVLEKAFTTASIISASGISNAYPTYATLNVTSTEAGTLYWVLLAGSNTTAPSATEVVNGTGPAGIASLNNGNVAISANTALSETISGLNPSTDYKVYFLVRDHFSNNSPIVEKTFTTLPAPSISTSSISGITPTSATLNVTSREAGTLYWVLLAGANTTVPNATEIVNGTGPAGAAPLNNGNELIIGVNTALSETISGLNPSTDYKVYFLVRDHFSNNSPIVEKVFTTASIISTSSISGITPTSATLNVTSDKAGTLYWVLLEGSNTTAPNAAEVINGTGPAGAVALGNGNVAISANTALSEAISDLTPSTDYKVYFCVQEGASNRSNVLEKTFRTNAPTAPSITSSSISGITLTSATLNVTSDKAGTLYWVLLAGSNTTFPSAAEVINGTGPAGTSALGSGNAAITANTALSEAISDLTPSTDYKVYFCVQEGASNRSNVLEKTFTTNAPTAPSITSSSISGITLTSATLNVTSNKAGRLYWVLLMGSNTTSPIATEVVNGTGPAGIASLNNGNAAINANTSLSQTISDLNASTDYKVYFCVQEGASNRSHVLEKTFMTKNAPDVATVFGTSAAKNNHAIRLYPNPFTKKVQLLLNLRQKQDIALSFIDISGRVVWQQSLKYVDSNTFTLEPNLKNNQLYYVSIKGKHVEKTLRLLMK